MKDDDLKENSRKNLPLKQAARAYLAGKSERELARLLRPKARPGFNRRRRGKSLAASNRWQKWELAWLGKCPDQELARRTGRTATAVMWQRRRLHIQIFNSLLRSWQKWELALLGKSPDSDVARRTGRTVKAITKRRRLLRIQMFNSGVQRWQKWEKDLLGKISDRDFAVRTGREFMAVRGMRVFLGIENFDGVFNRRWKERELKLLGKYPDDMVAHRTGRTFVAVKAARHWRGIARLDGPIHKRPSLPAWTDARLGTLPDAKLATQLHRTKEAVKSRRLKKGIPAFRRQRRWTGREDEILLCHSKPEAARRLNRPLDAVIYRHRQLKTGVALNRPPRPWTSGELALLGKHSDMQAAAKLGRSFSSVRWKRKALGISAQAQARPGTQNQRPWTKDEGQLLGAMPDLLLAQNLGRSRRSVSIRRRRLGIPFFQSSTGRKNDLNLPASS